MIIATRYRDIPWEEVQVDRCRPGGAMNKKRWGYWRGRAVEINVPGKPSVPGWVCEGPFYLTTRTSVLGASIAVIVCPHIAEIGD